MTDKYGEIVEVVEKPDEPTSNLVMTGFYAITPAIFRTCRLAQPSNRVEYEISEATEVLIRSCWTIDAIRLEGWRIGVGDIEDRDEAEQRLDHEVEGVRAESISE